MIQVMDPQCCRHSASSMNALLSEALFRADTSSFYAKCWLMAMMLSWSPAVNWDLHIFPVTNNVVSAFPYSPADDAAETEMLTALANGCVGSCCQRVPKVCSGRAWPAQAVTIPAVPLIILYRGGQAVVPQAVLPQFNVVKETIVRLMSLRREFSAAITGFHRAASVSARWGPTRHRSRIGGFTGTLEVSVLEWPKPHLGLIRDTADEDIKLEASFMASVDASDCFRLSLFSSAIAVLAISTSFDQYCVTARGLCFDDILETATNFNSMRTKIQQLSTVSRVAPALPNGYALVDCNEDAES
ncbi:hypothetical protein ACOME3_000835 [Neoechinorhynchus agilis]